MKRSLVLALLSMVLAVCSAPSVRAQSALFAGLIKNKGYVVGSPLAASGLMRLDADTSWTHIGWNHPRIFGVAVDPRDARSMYLAAGNGLMHSPDGGRSWKILTGWEITEPQDVAIDPNAPDHLYLATPYGVWRSENGGTTWIESVEGIPFRHRYTQDVQVDRTKRDRIVAATSGGIYISEDGAKTWRLAAAENVPIYRLDQGVADPNVWIAGAGKGGVLLSNDNGSAWRAARGVDGKTAIYGVAIDPTDSRRMAAGGWNTGVYVTANGGRSWRQQRKGLPVAHIYEVAFDPDHPGRLYAATVEHGIFRTDTMGRTWDYAGMYGTLVFDLTFLPQPAN